MFNTYSLNHSLTHVHMLEHPRLANAGKSIREGEEEEEALIGVFDGCLGLIGKHGEQLAPRWKLRQA